MSWRNVIEIYIYIWRYIFRAGVCQRRNVGSTKQIGDVVTGGMTVEFRPSDVNVDVSKLAIECHF